MRLSNPHPKWFQILRLPTIKHINWNRYITESIQLRE